MQTKIVQYLHGYRHGLRQPGQGITISLPSPPPDIDLNAVDRWLEQRLGMDLVPEPEHPLVEQHHDPEASVVASLVWRILLAGRYFQLTARIPVFETGMIRSVKRKEDEPSRWHAGVVVPMVDNVSIGIVRKAYNAATELINWVIRNYTSSEIPANLYQSIQKNVLTPLQSMIKSGISTIPVLEAAYHQGIPFRHMGGGIYQLGWGCHSRLIDRSSVDTDSVIGSIITRNKVSTASLIRSAGLPAPVHIVVNNEENALKAAAKLGWPLVVKPVDQERGEGVTVAITDERKLREAYKVAAALSKAILVEREAPGICYRLLVTNGKMLYAVRRGPRSVEGDGQNTIAELVRRATAENNRKPPWLRDKPYPLDEMAVEAMAMKGFTPESVPEKGVWVPLRRIESTEWGSHIDDVSEIVHPENRDIAERATRLFGLSNAGIDIISSDISRPWVENGAIINEVNYAPYFGGNEVARSLIPAHLEKLMGGNGRIPVEIFIGGEDALEEGRKRQRVFVEKGVECYLTHQELTLKPDGTEMSFPSKGIFSRATALLMNRDVAALVLVVQTNELLFTGLPVNHQDRCVHVDNEITDWRNSADQVGDGERVGLLSQLEMYGPVHSPG